MVLNVAPEKERISLGIKQLTSNPWEKVIPERYTVGKDEQVMVVKKTEFGLFVALEHDVEGLIPASEIPKGSTEIKEGEEITAQVIKVDGTERKIALSIKAHKKGQSKTKLEEFMSQQPKPDTSIGALLKERS